MEKDIDLLIQDCLQFFSKKCYTQERIYKYRFLWRSGILPYMEEKNLTLFSSSVGKQYISDCIDVATIGPIERDKIRSIQVLDDYLNLGFIRKRTVKPVEYPLSGDIGTEMEKLISHLQSLRRSSITIRNYRMYFNRFLSFLNKSGIHSIKGITEYIILKYISTTANNKVNIVSCLRVLFHFLFENHIISTEFDEVLKNHKWVKPEKIPSFYTADEVLHVEKSIDRSSGTGKRNYAMLLLASRLGLRASDIAYLQFSNIDWEKNEISLIQYKTGNPVTLPLLSDVGNAIIDYLKYGRCNSESQNVFISSRAPFVPATNTMVCAAINQVISNSKLQIDGRHHGPHSMRHSLACCLLENEVSLPIISETLGHASTDTTRIYLRIDIKSLLKCALPVPPIPNEFYTQKGGAYYE